MIQRSRPWRSERLNPGERAAVSEEEWYHYLEASEPLHQWGSAFLMDEGGDDGSVRVYVRDATGNGRHGCLRLDRRASRRAREGVRQVEHASRRAADLVTAILRRGRATLDEQRHQDEASRRYVQVAEELYRELLGG